MARAIARPETDRTGLLGNHLHTRLTRKDTRFPARQRQFLTAALISGSLKMTSEPRHVATPSSRLTPSFDEDNVERNRFDVADTTHRWFHLKMRGHAY